MQYVRLIENRAVEIIPEFDPSFPDVPISSRYTKGFIAGLIPVADDAVVQEGWIYDTNTGTFAEPTEEPIAPSPDEPKPEEDSSVWNELDAAYQEGVDSV